MNEGEESSARSGAPFLLGAMRALAADEFGRMGRLGHLREKGASSWIFGQGFTNDQTILPAPNSNRPKGPNRPKSSW
jgi:hypothetical protein